MLLNVLINFIIIDIIKAMKKITIDPIEATRFRISEVITFPFILYFKEYLYRYRKITHGVYVLQLANLAQIYTFYVLI